MEKVTLTAPDISCQHCVNAIKKAVGALPGVFEVEASADTKKVSVEYDPQKLTVAQIEEAMAGEGYPVAK
ncbi:MAG: copper ion binding protein [Chloroflexi bacterium]|nr:copper ion binding protein [Chloroflexota bacterium]